MNVTLKITGEVPDEAYEELKKLEHHLEYSGLLENYPELQFVHCEVSKGDHHTPSGLLSNLMRQVEEFLSARRVSALPLDTEDEPSTVGMRP